MSPQKAIGLKNIMVKNMLYTDSKISIVNNTIKLNSNLFKATLNKYAIVSNKIVLKNISITIEILLPFEKLLFNFPEIIPTKVYKAVYIPMLLPKERSISSPYIPPVIPPIKFPETKPRPATNTIPKLAVTPDNGIEFKKNV